MLLRTSVATLRRVLEERARRVEVDRLVELAVPKTAIVGNSKSPLRVFIATLRRLLEPHERHHEVDRQVELAVFVGNSESPLRPSVATFCRVDVQSPSKS